MSNFHQIVPDQNRLRTWAIHFLWLESVRFIPSLFSVISIKSLSELFIVYRTEGTLQIIFSRCSCGRHLSLLCLVPFFFEEIKGRWEARVSLPGLEPEAGRPPLIPLVSRLDTSSMASWVLISGDGSELLLPVKTRGWMGQYPVDSVQGPSPGEWRSLPTVERQWLQQGRLFCGRALAVLCPTWSQPEPRFIALLLMAGYPKPCQ